MAPTKQVLATRTVSAADGLAEGEWRDFTVAFTTGRGEEYKGDALEVAITSTSSGAFIYIDHFRLTKEALLIS